MHRNTLINHHKILDQKSVTDTGLVNNTYVLMINNLKNDILEVDGKTPLQRVIEKMIDSKKIIPEAKSTINPISSYQIDNFSTRNENDNEMKFKTKFENIEKKILMLENKIKTNSTINNQIENLSTVDNNNGKEFSTKLKDIDNKILILEKKITTIEEAFNDYLVDDKITQSMITRIKAQEGKTICEIEEIVKDVKMLKHEMPLMRELVGNLADAMGDAQEDIDSIKGKVDTEGYYYDSDT